MVSHLLTYFSGIKIHVKRFLQIKELEIYFCRLKAYLKQARDDLDRFGRQVWGFNEQAFIALKESCIVLGRLLPLIRNMKHEILHLPEDILRQPLMLNSYGSTYNEWKDCGLMGIIEAVSYLEVDTEIVLAKLKARIKAREEPVLVTLV